MSTSELYVVAGAGQIGSLVVDRLLARGQRVRQIRRGPTGGTRPNLEQRSGDLADPVFAREAMAGAAVVVHCVNPPYDRWPTMLLPLTRGVMAGAAEAGARLIVLDNLYMYDPAAGPMRPDSPVAPRGRKGALRAQQGEELLAAHHSGKVRLSLARASDFIGPSVTLGAIFGERYWKRVLAGGAAECFGDPDQPHSYSYSHDVADGLIQLADHPDTDGRIWHLPVAPAEPTKAWMSRIAEALQVRLRIARVPDLALRALGVFSPLMREVAEMTYQWKMPFVLDDSAYRARFSVTHTPVEEVVTATVAWAQRRYGGHAVERQ